ncbi:oxygen-independent coproporphyrinogen III oxidase [Chelatococcus sp. SYSU_G07232]|uniref:Coproporphyrinogen-III oxidase n=1 Tax=Chelatococcus albus TaxID=3047466 RepID=A0ABT7AG01_9HYPH|nr:oxygen-independent coproporphyrinogen III oxidase [Chelatococcus sp. SYSU_G07232]MDJ1158035.1 oxygen-independent coproporphyrinogen III oxidase [Chelatococcus sp. SYSU_G07232]
MQADLITRYDQRVPRYTSYPTAPHFGADVDGGVYAGWLEALDETTTLSLYLHVPFCAELCLYCGCHTTVARRYGPVAAYVELLLREITLAAAQLPGRFAVSHIHWGGGTPTILAPEDLLRVTEALRSHFSVRDDAETAIEIDPRTLAAEHVPALAAMGVTRASLGVQDFDPKVQRAIGRTQSYAQTARAAGWLGLAGARSLNLDLIYGLPHQTVESVVASVGQALRLGPDRIALFGYAHVPWMKKHQKLLPEDALPDTAERLAQMQAATDAITSAGYVAIGLDHFAKPGDALARARAEGRLHRNFQGYTTDAAPALIGFGTSAIGSLPQGYVQNAATTVAYRDALTAGRLPIARGIVLTSEDRLRRAVIERLMCDLAVDLAAVAAIHGRPAHVFAGELPALDRMAADGILQRDGWRIAVPDSARLYVRNVCAVFDARLAEGQARYSRAL